MQSANIREFLGQLFQKNQLRSETDVLNSVMKFLDSVPSGKNGRIIFYLEGYSEPLVIDVLKNKKDMDKIYTLDDSFSEVFFDFQETRVAALSKKNPDVTKNSSFASESEKRYFSIDHINYYNTDYGRARIRIPKILINEPNEASGFESRVSSLVMENLSVRPSIFSNLKNKIKEILS